ncbi:NADP-dependent oxidoreductase [Nocardia barduliensis]|uniref:NADP-dependent oxidoreductase n=1 Tax=Nocardia barduliensis TaxID=2736643 RepID=UPI001572CB2B|nr:NADP-dependent oxidoreductase [Nocardia barduliensis]
MRSFVLTGFGDAPQVRDVDIPAPAAGEIQVRVHAASVNGFDLATAGGYFADMMEHRFPVVLGKDFAGVVESVGANVDQYSVGDRVFGVVTKPYLGEGSFAEFVNVPVAVGLARLPEGIDFTTGAALGLAGVAALQGIEIAAPRAGQTVLVVGATGGVGSQVVQLAKNAGATVIATAATDEEEKFTRSQGADHTVNHNGDLTDAVRSIEQRGVDVAFHLAGDPSRLLDVVKPGGQVISTLLGSPDQLPSETVRVHALYANPDTETLNRLAALHRDDTTSVSIQSVFPLERAAEAFDRFASGTLGKIVITTR